MRIKTRFTLTIWTTVLILAAGTAFTVAGIVQTRGMLAQSVQLHKLEEDLFTLREFSLEYAADPTTRALNQWRRTYDQIRTDKMTSAGLPSEVEEAFANIQYIFDQLVRSARETAATAEEDRAQAGLRRQLLSTLLVETQRMLDWTRLHVDDSQKRLLTIVGTYSVGAVLLLAAIAALTALILITSRRHILRSVQTLGQGAQMIAQGRLDHRLALSADDEFGELAAAFNAMVEKLQAQAVMESRLAQSQRLEAIGTLAGGIAHDFNNILMAIIGYAELTRLKNRDEKVGEYLQSVLAAAARATDLVKQILTFSRMTRQEARPVQVSLIVKEVLKLLRASIPSTIEIRPEIVSEAVVLADPTDIHRILVNLCTNAAIAMREHGGILEVGLETVAVDAAFRLAHTDLACGSYLRLSVRDTGCGMTPEVKARVFDPFFTTHKDDGGTGMGLSVVHGIVKSLYGMVSVESEPGEGTTFSVLLPVAQPVDEPAVARETATPHGNERILFVDDEPSIVAFSRELLGSLGYRVSAYLSSTKALEAFAAAPGAYDLVITDMTMPELTGEALAGKLRELRPDVPVILCTGFSERMNAEKARRLGVNGFLEKPYTASQIAMVLRAVLGGLEPAPTRP